jgi:outer membrane protein assembly factor BamB
MLISALLFLGTVMGGYAYHYGVFPGNSLKQAFQGLDAVLAQRRQLSHEYNRGGSALVSHDKAGVTLWDKEQAHNGYTLIASAQGQTVRLIDMQGATVYSWELDYLGIWNDADQVKEPVPERFIFVRNAKLQPDGGLLLSFSAWATTPHGYGIARIDKDSNVLWANFRHIHHSFDQLADGTVVALDYEIQTEAPEFMPQWPVPHLGDGLSFYSQEGELLRRHEFIDSFYHSPYRPVLESIALKQGGDGLGDYLHSNDVEVLRADIAEQFPMAVSGDLLISFRALDGLAILDKDSLQVKWFERAYWRGQHDPDFLPNGNILLFDNIALRLDANSKRRSRVIEFDPKTMEMVWQYSGTDEQPFYSNSRAAQQRLANGNTLITEANSGRLLEVSRQGEIVWEYFNPQRVGAGKQRIPALFWARRYMPEDINFALVEN